MRTAVLLVSLFLGSCGSDEKDTIVYAGSAWYGHAPVWVGISQGIFEKHGFKVEQRSFGPSADRISALEANNAQFASLGEVAMLAAMARGHRNFYWIGCQNIAPGNEGLVAIGIDSIAELKGKTIALQERSSIHLTIALLLEAHGLDIRKDVSISHATDSAVVELVRNGNAQAGGIWEPFYTHLRELPGARVLATDKDTSVYRKYKMMTGPDVICASKEWVDADPERAKRFFKAYFEAVQWCADNPEKLLNVVVDEVKQERVAVETTLKNFQWISWDQQRAMMSEHRMFGQAREVSGLLKKLGVLESVPAFKDWTRVDWFE